MKHDFIKNNKILIAEDSLTQGTLIVEMLKEFGYEVVYKSDGKQAVEYLKETEERQLPSIVISDINMPDMDGFQLCSFIRKNYPEILFIMITSYNELEVMEKAYKIGAHDFVTKPLFPSELKARINNLINARNSELIVKDLLKELKSKNEKLTELSITDELTQIYNRRYMVKQLNLRIKEASRYKYPLSVIMVDIDDFKRINDTFGHLNGDKVLHLVASELVNNSRTTDLVGRYGGEEFIIILPSTEFKGAKLVAEKIRDAVRNISFDFLPESRQLTVSLGVADYDYNMTGDKLLEKADEMLYKAKTNGKDRVES